MCIRDRVDTPQNLYDMPCNMFVAGFIGSPQMNFLDGTLIKQGDLYGIDLGGDVIPLPKEKTADGKLDSYCLLYTSLSGRYGSLCHRLQPGDPG